MNKAAFLDRDGTINVEKHYIYKIEDFEFLPGAIEALKVLQSKGYLLIIITNQSGIARGYYTEDEYKMLEKWLVSILKSEGVHITATYYCPHLPDAPVAKYRRQCNCRKPKLGLFERAIREYDIDLNNSFAVGDKIRDCSICEYTSCRGYLIGQNEHKVIIDRVKNEGVKQMKYCTDLLEVAKMVL